MSRNCATAGTSGAGLRAGRGGQRRPPHCGAAVLASARRLASAAMLAIAALTGCGPARITADDVVLIPGRPALLSASVERDVWPGWHEELKHVTVQFVLDGREVAATRTDGEGCAALATDLPDDPNAALEAVVVIGEQPARATATVHRWSPARVAIAVDLDGTIADTKYGELLKNGDGDASPAVSGALPVLQQLAANYEIAYVTSRPRSLLVKTRRWLTEQGFPPGPVITAERTRDAMDPASFKMQVLRELRHYWPTLLIGIGNRAGDAAAYGGNGMLPLLVRARKYDRITPPAGTLWPQEWATVARFFAEQGAVLHDPAALDAALHQVPAERPWGQWKADGATTQGN